MKTIAFAALLFFWPPWLSIESPVNPYDPSTRNAIFLVHAMTREGTPQLADLSATAEGLVNGARETITVKLDATDQPGTFRRAETMAEFWRVADQRHAQEHHRAREHRRERAGRGRRYPDANAIEWRARAPRDLGT